MLPPLSTAFRFSLEHTDATCGARVGRWATPHGTIETHVWSPVEGGTDFGIQNSLPTAVSRLPRLAVVTLS